MANPRRGDRGCLAGKKEQTICLAVDLFFENRVTGHIQLGFKWLLQCWVRGGVSALSGG